MIQKPYGGCLALERRLLFTNRKHDEKILLPGIKRQLNNINKNIKKGLDIQAFANTGREMSAGVKKRVVGNGGT